MHVLSVFYLVLVGHFNSLVFFLKFLNSLTTVGAHAVVVVITAIIYLFIYLFIYIPHVRLMRHPLGTIVCHGATISPSSPQPRLMNRFIRSTAYDGPAHFTYRVDRFPVCYRQWLPI
jgi:hypothetical protein